MGVINIDVAKGTYCSIIHEVGHALHHFNGIRNLSKNRKCKNDNNESVSVYFEVLASDPLQKGMRLRNMLNALRHYMGGYRHEKPGHFQLPSELYEEVYKDSEEGNFKPFDCLLTQGYNTSLYNAFKLSDRVAAGEISVLEGMNEAMYGEIPPLTPAQFDELIDRLAS